MAVLANEYFPKFTAKIITITPLIGVFLTTLLCASPVNSKKMKFNSQYLSLIAVVVHSLVFNHLPSLLYENLINI